MAADRRPAAWHVVILVCFLPTVSACLGDPPPDPASAPLEVVLDGCGLNRDEVAPGEHEVSVVGEGRLVVTDAAGQEVLRLPDGTSTLATTAQTYTMTCVVEGEETTATLTSVAAGG
ncbi:hypothetical protein [Serinicoccus sp. CUA-874]|uniref:hypothetical protein n=1 Tax=Serinicoccus sp. CUA-874 TaxID=1517939 RepID=UPI00117AFDF1|nr:hypothetical protein [Serinicoccus sp. CUA-874]